MRIAYVSATTIPGRKASSVHIMKMCAAMAANGHHVLLANTTDPFEPPTPTEDVYGYYGVPASFKINYWPAPRFRSHNLLTLVQTWNRLRKLFSSFRPDLVYSRNVYGAWIGILTGHPTIFESHVPITDHPTQGHAFAYRELLRSPLLKRFVVITEALKKKYLELGTPDPNLLHVAPDAADNYADVAPSPLWPGRTQALQVGYVGSLYPGRGVSIILNLAKHFPDMDFHLVGGPNEQSEHLRKDCTSPNLFIHGHVPPGETPAFRAACDVLLAPHQQRVFTGSGCDITNYCSPMKIFEYMASKKAIICSSLPVLKEIMNESNSILAPPGDPKAWRAALKSLRNITLRETLANAAYSDFQASHTWRIRSAKVLDGIQEGLS